MAVGPRYQIEFTRPSAKVLVSLSEELQRRIGAETDALTAEPRPPGSEKLKGSVNQYRVRVGDYRIIYAINDEALRVRVQFIGHRRDVYKKRKRGK